MFRCESETSLDKARLAINAQTSKISPVTLATHQVGRFGLVKD